MSCCAFLPPRYPQFALKIFYRLLQETVNARHAAFIAHRRLAGARLDVRLLGSELSQALAETLPDRALPQLCQSYLMSL